ncbi:MAG: IPT/TIG domain-containing protein [Patescibacteria group bacterium]
MKRLTLIILAIMAIAIGVLGVIPFSASVAHAQTTSPILQGLNVVGANTSLPSSDPRIIVGRLINVVLGLLAFILLILILYAGFIWMTAGGDEAKVKKAQAYIRNAIIGVIIILCSWAIARYVLTKLLEAVGGGSTPTTGGGNPGGGGFEPSGGSSFRLISITPSGSVNQKKIIVKIVFNHPVDALSVGAADAIKITKTSDGSTVAGTVEVTGNVVRFRTNTPCPPPNNGYFCFDDTTAYHVAIAPTVKSVDAQTLTCGGFAPSCEGDFTSGTVVDLTPPDIVMTYPVNGFSVSTNALVNVDAFASSPNGIGYVNFMANGTDIGNASPAGGTPKNYSASVQWDTTGIAPGTTIPLIATAYDIDSGVTATPPTSVIIRAASCFNGKQDGTETGVDCGGDANAPTYCGACDGGSCTQSTECASGVCTNGVCVQQPIITSVSPLDGAPGTYVTISGENFGTNGFVTFLGTTTPVRASAPPACTAQNAPTWSPTQVVVEVPTGAQNGPLRLTNNVSALSDDTNAAPGPDLPNFVINNTLPPGICAVAPASAAPSVLFRLFGTGFGTVSAGIAFGSKTLVATAWGMNEIDALVPNVAVGSYPISVTVGGLQSNTVTMNVTEASAAGVPTITDITPNFGPIGTYVTLTGTSFGNSPGQVFFLNTANQQSALADTNFPAGCAVGFWTNNSIVVKVPNVFTQGGNGGLIPGGYTVHVKTANPADPQSNGVNFSVNTNPLGPGICSIVPRVAPVGTKVQISGQGFTGGPGTATFYQNAIGQTASWSNASIEAQVPSSAQTGPVVVKPQSSGLSSNPYTIEIRNCNEAPGVCSSSDECCSDGACRPTGTCPSSPTRAMYAWEFSTGIIPRAPQVVEQCSQGLIPSPTPWSVRQGGTDACVNDILVMLFTTYLDPVSVSLASGNIVLEKCTGSGSDPCTQTTPAQISTVILSHANDTQDTVEATPSSLDQNSWYQVRVKIGVKGAGNSGLPMVEQKSKCGAGTAYCYTFKTRNDASLCEIGNVLVSPNPFTAHDQNQQIAYGALPQPKGDMCRVLNCDPYSWSWGTSDARASVTNAMNPNQPANVDCHQTVTAIGETGPNNPVQITAQAAGTTGAGDLYIRYVPPQVTDEGPKCDSACSNAAIWAEFNVPLKSNVDYKQLVRIERCANEACLELLSPATLDVSQATVSLQSIPGSSGTDGRYLLIEPKTGSASGYATLLEPGRFYRVVLLGGTASGILSSSNVPLAGLNAPDGFAWTFRVKPGDNADCKPDRLDLAPAEKFEKMVGDRQSFSATPSSAPDACSDKGQVLMSLDSYAWNVADTNVAILLNGGALDTGTMYPPGCTDKCLPKGSQGIAGKMAICGNNTVESQFEQCDGQAGCGDRCLWLPIKTVAENGSCGNGVLDSQEACDYGRVCTGLPADASFPAGGNCTAPALATACQTAGGTCDTRNYRGCSTHCQHLGSAAAGTTCGNSDVSDGEDCDDGNTQNGDGCSSNCLREGSSKTVYAVCGNGILEPGETCEKTANVPWPNPGCDPNACLHTGVLPCTASGQTNCCGDGNAAESGKDCDGGDGCSPICLLEGSSSKYAQPSFCRDGVVGNGELAACEAPVALNAMVNTGPDGLVDATQIGQVVGRGTPDKDGILSTDITASYSGLTATSKYGLQCGHTNESQCTLDGSISLSVGLSDNGCCSLRPALQNPNPLGVDVCRNALIRGSFSTKMDEQSLRDNFVVAEVVQGSACPNGTQVFAQAPQPRGFFAWLAKTWKSFLSLFGVRTANAQSVSCIGGVTGQLQFMIATTTDNLPYTAFAFSLDHALSPNTSYQVIFKGDLNLADNTAKDNKTGIRTADGIVSNQNWQWSFRTGTDICTLTDIQIEDQYQAHPLLFTASNEAHSFIAMALSRRKTGAVAAISPTSEYAWEWQPWVLSNRQIVELNPNAGIAPTLAMSAATVSSKNVSGSGFVNARVHITTDSVDVPSMQGKVIQGTVPITVNICEDPWPSKIDAPFRDEFGSPSLQGTDFQNGPYYNFSMMYCRDAGEPGALGDLPLLNIHTIKPNAADTAQGIVRQYLLTFSEPELKKDAIGIRIANNPMHVSPKEWYAAKGFTGSPQDLTIDGYQAIKDGRTVYISAANTNGPGTPIYSNITILSYNDGAEATTRQIYDALLASLAFNINIQDGVSNACEMADHSLALSSDGNSVSCVSDVDCRTMGAGATCANIKAKLQRDLIRLGDLQRMTRSLDDVKKKNGSYPPLANGSYITALSTSLWPSWTDAMQKATGGGLPKDPINRFVTCGTCVTGGNACVSDSDCSSGDRCASQGGFDPVTCWNQDSSRFMCPLAASGAEENRAYTYKSIGNGNRAELDSNFEVQPPNAADPTQNWWQPPLPTTVKRCTNGSALGNFCNTDADCAHCSSAGVCSAVPSGACQTSGISFSYSGVCLAGAEYGQTGTCGDGVVNPSSGEVCDTQGPSAKTDVYCSLASGSIGALHKICQPDCKAYMTDPKNPACASITTCGNGKIEGQCSNDPVSCTKDSDCGTGGACDFETCDDGVLNGTYGHCNKSCIGYGGYCGDAVISGGEVCDNLLNADWTVTLAPTSCNLSCTGIAAYCGDEKINGLEQCDGGTQSTDKALCSISLTPCSSNADCASGETCGGTASTNACAPAHVCTGGTDASEVGKVCDGGYACQNGATCSAQAIPTVRTRSCNPPSAVQNVCQWAGWGSCMPAQSCGNGIKEGAEECDDGSEQNGTGGKCDSNCKLNTCGDGVLYKGVEECDMGTGNGTLCTTAEYGATCSSCSKSCKVQLTQGGFCGDGIVQPGTSEQCDGSVASTINADQSASDRFCQTLGYDYANASTKVTCSQSCTFAGCQMCGEKPAGASASDPLYKGIVEGQLFDTLSQQPVPNARVTLFYRGLQVAVITSGQDGYFKFENLDRHSGCGQYRMIADEYGDNPKTPLIDESKRGGYMPVQTPPFYPYTADGSDVSTYTNAMVSAGIAVTTRIPSTSGYDIPRYSMLPRLKAGEYVVQFWWDPIINKSVQDTIAAFQATLASTPNGSAFYGDGGVLSYLHDLVVRVPYAYTPGSFARCTLPKKSIQYDGTNGGRNPEVTSANVDSYVPGKTGADQQDNPMTSMTNCTNKIRATAQKTCSGGDIPNNFQNQLACTMGGVNWECNSNLIIKYPYNNSTMCGNTAEPSRAGSPSVLSGSEGAYLFCMHPEWPDESSERSQPSCTNFIIPPQSVFIHGNGGQYDILVSAYQMFQNGSNDYPSIRQWLKDHGGKIQLYDQYGLNKEWKASDFGSLSPGWNANDDLAPTNICMPSSARNLKDPDTKPYSADNRVTNQRMFNYYATDISTVWTPFSIDTTANRVIEWNGGNTGADYRYFADLYTYEWAGRPNPGFGSCWERTCDKTRYGSVYFPNDPPQNGGAQKYICNDGVHKYGGDYTTDPACDSASQSVCPTGSVCKNTVDSSRRCIQVCLKDSDCQNGGANPNAFCGGAGLNNDDRCGGPGAVVGR